MGVAEDVTLYLIGGLYEFLLGLYVASFYSFRRGKGWFGKWKPRDIFHVLIILLLSTRGVIFLLTPAMIDGPLKDFPVRLYLLWFYLDSLLYFFAYLVLVIYWANEFFSVVYGSDRFWKKIRWALIVLLTILGLISFVFVVLFTIWASDEDDLTIVDRTSAVYVSVLNLLTTAGFLFYAIRLYYIMKRYHFPVDVRRKKARRIGYIAAFCSFFFTIRGGISLFSVAEGFALDNVKSSKGFETAWYVVLIFYLLFEIVPLCAMLFFYRKARTSKVQRKIDYESGSESEYGTMKSDGTRDT